MSPIEGQKHYTSPTNPNHVVGAEMYRISKTAVLTPEHEDFERMVDFLPEGLTRRPDGYGLVFYESEEHSFTYFGSPAQVEAFRANPGPVDLRLGENLEQWLNSRGSEEWDSLIGESFWNRAACGDLADGVGVVTTIPHTEIPGAELIVFEFEGSWMRDTPARKLVTYHCTGCHMNTFNDCGHVHENSGPHSRRWAGRQARQHIASARRHGVGTRESACRPNGGEMLRVVNEVARKMNGTTGNALPDTDDGYCAVHGPCSIIRELRAGIRPAPYHH